MAMNPSGQGLPLVLAKKPSVAIHYKPTASGAGQDAVKLDKDAFGMSDCHYLESEYTADPYLQMYPGVDAAVVPCYNLPELLACQTRR
jgi:hypothetical protein